MAYVYRISLSLVMARMLNKEHSSSARFLSGMFLSLYMPLRNYLLGATYREKHSKYNPYSLMIQLNCFQ